MKLQKLEKLLLRQIGVLNREYKLIRPGDKILIAVSGGKDSLVLAKLFQIMRKKAPFVLDFEAVTIDMGLPEFEKERLSTWMENQKIKYEIIDNDIMETVAKVVPKGKLPCTACARFRRGVLYNLSFERKAILALGHHSDDTMETLLMNIFYSGKIQAMPPVLVSDDKRNRLIRPLLYCRETHIQEYAELIDAPVLKGCYCSVNATQFNSKRDKMKELIKTMEKDYPELGSHLLNSLSNIRKSNLMDKNLWNFEELNANWENKNNIIWKKDINNKENVENDKN
jgi:tRNA 2-thiocytidine biosynthesis protein TtcA